MLSCFCFLWVCFKDVKVGVFLLLYDVEGLGELVLEYFFIVLVYWVLLLNFLIRIFFEDIIGVGELYFVVGLFIVILVFLIVSLKC